MGSPYQEQIVSPALARNDPCFGIRHETDFTIRTRASASSI
jgi:hypothetical protein